jgi:hypothetical protein
MAMTPMHRDVAKALLAAADAEGATDASVATALRDKTTGLIARVRAWFPDGVATASVEGVAAFTAKVRSEGVSANVEAFLWALARAELSAVTLAATPAPAPAPAAAAATDTAPTTIGPEGDGGAAVAAAGDA